MKKRKKEKKKEYRNKIIYFYLILELNSRIIHLV